MKIEMYRITLFTSHSTTHRIPKGFHIYFFVSYLIQTVLKQKNVFFDIELCSTIISLLESNVTLF